MTATLTLNNYNQNLIEILKENKLLIQNMYETGAVSTDVQGYNQLVDMAHSTFDSSKVTVVGSPTITEDGWLNGSKNNYLVIPAWDTDGAWSFEIEFYKVSDSDVTGFLLGSNSSSICIYNTTPTTPLVCGFCLSDTGYTGDKVLIPASYGSTQNKKIKIIIDYDGTSIYTMNVYIDGEFYRTVTYTNEEKAVSTDINCGLDVSFYVNLKSIKITVAGSTILTYNKTGTDVIKEDDYTLIGSPDVSDDGILSNCSDGNVLQTPVTLSDLAGNSWNIKGSAVLGDEAATLVKLSSYADKAYVGYGGLIWRGNSLPQLYFYARTGTSDDDSNETVHIQATFEVGDTIYYQLNFDYASGVYSLYADTTDGTTFIGSWTPDTSNKELYYINTNPEYYITLGCGTGNDYYLTTGSIDLNNFLVYINGDLFYQPCLKIPYTLSSTGSKIVDVLYRSRVQNLYEQDGKALYYTLDETNNNFTLPMGEIYGMMKSYVDENTSAVQTNIDNTAETLQTNIDTLQNTVETDYLPLTGGTMTGSIVSDMPLDDAISAYNANFVIVNPNYTESSTVDGTEHQGGGLSIVDTDGNLLVQFRAYQSATAGHCASIENRAVIDGTACSSYLRIYTLDDGTTYVTCSSVTDYTDSSTKIATTAFVKSVLSGSGYGMATYSKSSNGYIKFANGIIIQWGRTTLSINSTTSVTLPTAFSSTNYNVTTTWRSSANLDDNCNAYDYTTTGFTLYGTNKGANDSYSSVPVAWQAIGY